MSIIVGTTSPPSATPIPSFKPGYPPTAFSTCLSYEHEHADAECASYRLNCGEQGAGTITKRTWKKSECNGPSDASTCFQTHGCFPDTTDASTLYSCIEDDNWPWVRLFIFPGNNKCDKRVAPHYAINLAKSVKKDHIRWLYLPGFDVVGTTMHIGVAYNGHRPALDGRGVQHDFFFLGSVGQDSEAGFSSHISLRNYDSAALS